MRKLSYQLNIMQGSAQIFLKIIFKGCQSEETLSGTAARDEGPAPLSDSEGILTPVTSGWNSGSTSLRLRVCKRRAIVILTPSGCSENAGARKKECLHPPPAPEQEGRGDCGGEHLSGCGEEGTFDPAGEGRDAISGIKPEPGALELFRIALKLQDSRR